MRLYLENVISGRYAYNHQIIQNFQDIFNLLPNFSAEGVITQFSVKTNDYMYVLYVTSLIKSVISLHTLINNKISNKDQQIEEKEKKEEKKEKKEEEKEKEKESEKA